MMRLGVKYRVALLLVLGTMLPSSYSDDGYRSKVGFDIKGFKPNLHNRIGWIGGGRWARYYGTSQVYTGLAAYFGAPTGLSIGEQRIYYGGLTLGYDGRLSKHFVYELGFLIGYGEGIMKSMGISERSYFVAEPSLSLGFALGGGWRLCFSGSYLSMNTAKNFSGSTFGVRLQYRSSSAIKDVND